MHGEVSTRPERLPDDGDFLLSLYASTRQPELAGLGWSCRRRTAGSSSSGCYTES